MPRSAQTLKQRERSKAQEDNARLEKAVAYYNSEQLAVKNEQRWAHGTRYFAALYKVNESTILQRAKGKQSIADFNTSKHLLTPGEAEMLLELICQSTNQGVLLTNEDIKEHVNAILHARLGKLYRPVGLNWVSYFKDIHSNRITSGWSSGLDIENISSAEAYTTRFSIGATWNVETQAVDTSDRDEW